MIWHQLVFFSHNTQIGGNGFIGHGVSSTKELQLLEIVASERCSNRKYSRASWNIDCIYGLGNEETHEETPTVRNCCHSKMSQSIFFLGFLKHWWIGQQKMRTILQYLNLTILQFHNFTISKFRARVSRPVLELRSGCTLASASSEPPTREGATTISSDAARCGKYI